SHSGALTFGHDGWDQARDEWFRREFMPVLGPNPTGGPNDLLALAERLPSGERPSLRFDCGLDDFLLDANRRFHRHLEQIDYVHEYEEFPGTHEWGYWDVHVRDALAFHDRNLGWRSSDRRIG
ncbi:MAG TPA: hypothetical protein VM328_10535, partial [Fimbriimonadaceae bacterium]|nr:hypothetical protein [Fimbriimonadaceae bacterium]